MVWSYEIFGIVYDHMRYLGIHENLSIIRSYSKCEEKHQREIILSLAILFRIKHLLVKDKTQSENQTSNLFFFFNNLFDSN